MSLANCSNASFTDTPTTCRSVDFFASYAMRPTLWQGRNCKLEAKVKYSLSTTRLKLLQ